MVHSIRAFCERAHFSTSFISAHPKPRLRTAGATHSPRDRQCSWLVIQALTTPMVPVSSVALQKQGLSWLISSSIFPVWAMALAGSIVLVRSGQSSFAHTGSTNEKSDRSICMGEEVDIGGRWPSIQDVKDGLVERTSVSIDLQRLKLAVQQVTLAYPWTSSRRQIGLTCRESILPSVEDGVGSLYNFEAQSWFARERDFKVFLPEFRDTYLHEIYLRLQDETRNRIGRVRLMNLAPKACYSLHRDPTVRYHIAIETNPQAFLIFAQGGLRHLPEDGFCYRVDTRNVHSAMNGGATERIHLVLSESEEGECN